MYKNLFFDFDGTLFNGYPKMLTAMQKMLFEKRKKEYSYDELYGLAMVNFKYLGEQLEFTHEEWERYSEIFETDNTLPEFAPFEGVFEMFETLIENDIKCFMYTNRNLETIDYMKKYDLHKYMTDYICDANKPSVGALDEMIKKYNLKKEECLVVGDRTLDIEGAIASNMDSFYINDYKEEPLATYQGKSFKDLINLVLN